MSLNILKKEIKVRPSRKKNQVSIGQLPVKRNVNLMSVGVTKINKGIAVPAIVVIIIIAVLLGKFAVVDRLMAAGEAQNRVDSMRAELDAGYAKIESYGKIAEKYAHYTYEDMTPEELSQTDRMDILELVQRKLLKEANVSSWSISGNQLQTVIAGSTLQRVNEIVQDLEKEDLVDYCSVFTANKGDLTAMSGSEKVTAQITVFFKVAEPEAVEIEDSEGVDDTDYSDYNEGE